MREKIIRGLISSIIVVLLLGFEYKLSFNIVHDFESRNTSYAIEDFYQINDYDVDGDKLVPTSADSQLILNFDGSVVDKVTVFLSEAPTDEIKGRLYFFEKKGFSEKNSIEFNLQTGENEASLNMNQRNVGYLRLDLDGEVSIDHIDVVSEIAHINIFKALVFCGLCALIDIAVWFLMYRKFLAIWDSVRKKLEKADAYAQSICKKIKFDISTFFAGFALIGGLVYSFIIPVGLVPDEPIHVELMCYSLGVEGLSAQYYNVLEQGNILSRVRDQQEDIDPEVYSAVSKLKFDKSQITFSPDIKKEVVGYIPCGIGFWLGYLFNLPIVWCAQLGEIFALIFFAIVGYFALKIMPAYKEVMCAIMLIPMNLQQCASLNYDSVLLPLCYLFVAYMFYLKYEKDKLDVKAYVTILVLIGLIALIKIPYSLLIGLYLIIPDSKKPYSLSKKAKLIIVIVVLCLGIAGMYVLRNVNLVYVILGSILQWKDTLRILKSTIGSLGWYYMQSMIGDFGWLDCVVPDWFIVFSLLSILAFAQIKQKENAVVRVWDRALYILLSCAIFVLVVIGILQWYMNLMGIDNSTLKLFRQGLSQVSVVAGIQGRYWLPILPCCILAFANVIPNKQNKLVIWQTVYYMVIAVVPLYELAYRYWI